MSTNAESARQWLASAKPNDQLLAETIVKLERRIKQHANEEEKIAGSLAALDVLEQEQLERQLSHPLSVKHETFSPAKLDLGELGAPSHDLEAPPRDQQEKKKRFAQLKQQLGQG